ncbi:MAG: hypothetical protein RMK91_10405 [Pseudanabaenaceae cyanobacterium SKYGB_i_bin29]|nr:hypothetical protein [Pseudanabaenaceae cyanobacterium SKYG29]MDW8422263.1 hypothetical protein [Pseudanabaenaceae cyanobacterium SKYGB_i_bin29]
MNKVWGLVILAAIGVGLPGRSQDRLSECLAIANVFQEAGRGYEMSPNIGEAIKLTDRLIVGMKKLNLTDAKLKSLQGRYISYFNSSNELLKKGQRAQNDEAALNALMDAARASSLMGQRLGQELAEYCLQ